MKIRHSPHHWVVVALVLAALLLTVSHVYGQQHSDSTAVFEGRPAMAGAQAGQGAMAGPPQGGIGVQGTDRAQRTVRPRATDTTNTLPQAKDEAGMDAVANANTDMILRKDRVVRRDRDSGIAKDQRSAVKKSKHAAKQIVKRARTGVGDIDATNKAGN